MQAVFGHAARRQIIFSKLLSRPAETARSASRRTISKIEVPAGESLSTSRCRPVDWHRTHSGGSEIVAGSSLARLQLALSVSVC